MEAQNALQTTPSPGATPCPDPCPYYISFSSRMTMSSESSRQAKPMFTAVSANQPSSASGQRPRPPRLPLPSPIPLGATPTLSHRTKPQPIASACHTPWVPRLVQRRACDPGRPMRASPETLAVALGRGACTLAGGGGAAAGRRAWGQGQGIFRHVPGAQEHFQEPTKPSEEVKKVTIIQPGICLYTNTPVKCSWKRLV